MLSFHALTIRLSSWGLMILFIFIQNDLIAQSLQRNVFLGARLADLSTVEEELGTDSGIYLSEIIPTGSLGSMGVPSGVVLKKVNDEMIATTSDLRPALHGIKEGDALSVDVYENGQLKTYSGTAQGRPKETHPHAVVHYQEVDYPGNRLRSLLYVPHGHEQPPVIFFIQGYTCQSIEMRNVNPAKQVINGFIEDGYAVFLVEKPGMGDSESDVHCMECDFNQELEAFEQAYDHLRQNPLIDAENIFIFGHSMGGIIAPQIGHEHPPAGILVYGVVGKNWYDYMIDIYVEQPLVVGADEAEILDNKKYYLPFIKDMLVLKKSNTELIQNEVYGPRLEEDGITASLSQGYYIHRHVRFWQTLTDVDIPKAWAQAKSPVMVLHGEYDIQAIHPRYAEMITDHIDSAGGEASFHLFPKTEHAFLKFNSREELNDTMNNGQYVQTFTTHFNPEITQVSVSWIKKHLRS